MNLINLQQPYLLFIGDAPDLLTAKTAKGVAHWRSIWACRICRLPTRLPPEPRQW